MRRNKTKPRTRKKPDYGGLFTVFGITINFNAVLTTVIASISWLLISTGLKWINDNNQALRTLPQIQASVQQIKSEQVRIRREYAPPVKIAPVEKP